jgi:hypothetical protein
MMKRSPEVLAALDGISLAAFGRARSVSIANNECVVCGTKDLNLRDQSAMREYSISGMCQKCQDTLYTVKGEMYGYVNQDR